MRPTIERPLLGARARGALLLADISGYTGFLQGVSDAHRALVIDADEPPAAYELVSSLLDTVVSEIAPRFRLVKFEGDAVFAEASDATQVPRGQALLGCIRSCYAAFRERLATAHDVWTCRCNSCSLISGLDLKFILHHGDYVIQRVSGQQELLGPDVNVVHRLLKNHVAELIGRRPYVLLTDTALESLDVPTEGMVAATETYEAIPPVAVHILALA